MALLPREDLTIEAIFSLFQSTVFNPFVTGPLSVVLLYFPQQVQSILPRSIRHYVTTNTFLWTLKVLVGYSVVRTLNNYLSRRVLNNWARDSWRHGKEIVLVTGSGGGARLTNCESPCSPSTYASMELAAMPISSASRPRRRTESSSVPDPMT